MEGRPRYLPVLIAMLTCKMFDMFTLAFAPTFLLKNISDLWKFICWPEVSSYMDNMFFNAFTSLSVALQNKKQSSTNKRFVNVRAPGHTRTP